MEFNLADLFEAVADAVTDREAVVDGARRLTYAALDERADRLASALADRGVGPGDHVGVWLGSGTEQLEVLLAAFKLRAAPVNINWRDTADDVRRLAADADLAALVHDHDAGAGCLPGPAGSRGRAGLQAGEAYEAALAAAPSGRRRDAGRRSGDDHYVLYTGGTTGRPKGVVWRHRDIFFAGLGGGTRPGRGGLPVRRPGDVAARAARDRASRCLVAAPLVHAAGQWAALATLYTGGTVVLCGDRGARPETILDRAAAERADSLVVVGDAMVEPLCRALELERGRWDLAPLDTVVSGGARLSPATRQALARLLPDVTVADVLGASETGGQGVASGPTTAPGRFRAHGSTAVLDDDLRPVAPGSGVVGRLARRGLVPLGYRGDPERTATAFPVIAGVRWAIPGDLATVAADGTVVLLGRGETAINTGGEKVDPEEVEVVLRAHADVSDAVVVGLPDRRWGERVTAVVAPRPGARPDAGALARHCRGTLAAYKVPRAVVVVDRVLRTPAGKPDYSWARAVAAGGGP